MITRRTLLKSLILPYFGHDFIVSAHEKNINININDSVSPEMFGAVGDGIKDDSLAMKMCFDSKKKVILKKMPNIFGQKKSWLPVRLMLMHKMLRSCVMKFFWRL